MKGTEIPFEREFIREILHLSRLMCTQCHFDLSGLYLPVCIHHVAVRPRILVEKSVVSSICIAEAEDMPEFVRRDSLEPGQA